MAIEDTERRVTYVGNGKQTVFPFSFVVFDPEADISVYLKEEGGEEAQAPAASYSVTLSADQAGAPGGSVRMTAAPAAGATVAILSSVAYTQTMELTTHDGFDPRTLNGNADRTEAQIQQLKEGLSRAVVTSATDTMTPLELKNKLLSAADTAYTVAKSYADAAGASAAEAAKSEAAARSSESAAAGSATASAASASASGNSASESASSASASAASAKEAAATVAGAKQEISDAKDAGVSAVESQADAKSAAEQIKAAADAQAERLSKITEAVVEQESHVIDDASSPQSFAVGNVSHVLVFIDSVLAVEGQSYGITGGDTVQFADALPVGTEVTLIKFVSAGAAAITPSYAIDSVLSDTSTNAVQNRIVKSAIEAAVKTALLSAHPVGSIYCSVESTDPATLFGGTWERIKDRFILAAGEAYAAGSTGGEATHTLTTAEMPTHSHRIRLNTESSGGYLPTGGKPNAIKTGETPLSSGASNGTFTDRSQSGDIGFASDFIYSEGGSSAHNNMPPYITAYCWRRTA